MSLEALPGRLSPWARLREAGDGYRGLLGQRDPALLLAGGAISVIGDWLNTVALVELSYRLGEGSFGVGGLLAMRMLPPLLFQGAAGALVDRLPGRRLLVGTQLLMAVIAGSFALLAAVPQLWLLYALVFTLETTQTVARPATMVRFMEVVQPEQRGAANALYGMTSTTAQFGGASVGALLFALIGATPLFLLNSVTFLVVALAVSRTSPGQTRRIADQTSASSAAMDGVVDSDGSTKGPNRAGYRRLLRRMDVVGYAGVTITISILIQSVIALFPVRSRDLGLGEGGAGICFAVVAIGFLLGNAVAGSGTYGGRTTLYLVAAAEAAGAAGIAMFGAIDRLIPALAGLLAAGVLAELAEVPALTYFQNQLPDGTYGRFYSVVLTASAAGGLTGALLGPLLERAVGPSLALALLAGLVGIVAAAFALSILHEPPHDAAPHPTPEPTGETV